MPCSASGGIVVILGCHQSIDDSPAFCGGSGWRKAGNVVCPGTRLNIRALKTGDEIDTGQGGMVSGLSVPRA